MIIKDSNYDDLFFYLPVYHAAVHVTYLIIRSRKINWQTTGVVIGKLPTTFFNCPSSWPRMTGHFPLVSLVTEEAFLSIWGVAQTRFLQNSHVQYMTSTIYGLYGITHVIIENTHRNEIFWWLLSLIGNNSLFIYILTKLLHELIHI